MCGIVALRDWRLAGFTSELHAITRVMHALRAMSYRGTEEPSVRSLGPSIIGHVRLPIQAKGNPPSQPTQINVGTPDEQLAACTGEFFNYSDLYPPSPHFVVPSNDTVFFRDSLKGLLPNRPAASFAGLDGFWNYVVVKRDPAGFSFSFASDFLGIKPLYLHERLGIVASEPMAVARLIAPHERVFNNRYFGQVARFGYSPLGDWAIKGVVRLRENRVLSYHIPANGGKFDWKGPKVTVASRDLVIPHFGSFEEAFVQAVKNRFVGSWPVGLLLSGGLDSTLVLAAAIHTGADPKRMVVYHTENNEARYAEMAARRFGVELKATPSYYDPLPEEAMITHMQGAEDLGSLEPQIRLAQALRKEGVHVVMTGDGADELFGGYSRAQRYDSQAADLEELKHYHLLRLDRIMMRATIEQRSPFLSPFVISHALNNVPWAHRTGKQVLKELAARLGVPKAIIARKKAALRTSRVERGGAEHREALCRALREHLASTDVLGAYDA